MPKQTLLQKLQYYAAYNIHNLARQDPGLEQIDKLVQIYLGISAERKDLLSDEATKKLTRWLPEDAIDKPFSKDMVQGCVAIGQKVLEAATDTNSNNNNLLLVAKYLQPLLSQDDRTVDIGFDLVEYMDWYFKDTTRTQRKQYAKKLMDGWTQNE